MIIPRVPGQKQRLSDETKAAILADYSAGAKISWIASIYGVHESYPANLVKSMGRKARGWSSKYPPLRPQDRQDARQSPG